MLFKGGVGGGEGGRGNIAQFMAINNDVLFPCEMARQLSLRTSFHSAN